MSHGVGPGLDGLGHGAVLASVGVFAVPGLGHGASRAVGRGWICGRAGPLGLMVERRHEAWQGATVINAIALGEGQDDGIAVAVTSQSERREEFHRRRLGPSLRSG